MIGKRLNLARRSLGLSLDELEKRIGKLVTVRTLEKYEGNEIIPNSQVLIALADVLDVTETFLMSQRKIQLDGVVFQKKSVLKKTEEARIESLVLDFMERYLEIEDCLNIKNLYWDTPRNCPVPVHEIAIADLTARYVREHWQIGMAPILHLAEFLEERGIKVLSLPLPNTVSGLTCWVNHGGEVHKPIIVINESHSGEWQRFTLSHELGHLVQKVANNIDEEKAANRFAGAFLMPTEMLWEVIGTHRNTLSLGELFELKALFGTSIQAIITRCMEIGIINDAAYQRLFEPFKHLGWHQPPYNEPQPYPQEKSDRFKRLCFRALAENMISEPKTAELLGLSVHELADEMEGASTT